MKFREITAADVPSLFYIRPRTRENAMTLEQLDRLGINPQSVTESLGISTKGWLCEDSDNVVGFSMADRATGEFLVIAVDYGGWSSAFLRERRGQPSSLAPTGTISEPTPRTRDKA